MSATIGTSHFVSLDHATRYYADYGFDRDAVQAKIADGEIHLGAPSYSNNQRLETCDNGTRYAIVDGAQEFAVKTLQRIDLSKPRVASLVMKAQHYLNGAWGALNRGWLLRAYIVVEYRGSAYVAYARHSSNQGTSTIATIHE